MTHPHVQDEHLCEGSGQQSIQRALSDWRLYDFFLIVRQILSTYSIGHAYVELADWNGKSCSGCDCPLTEDESYSCQGCNSTLCSDCTIPCGGWLRLLPSRERKIALDLAAGETTSGAGAEFGVTPGRIWQLRQWLRESWKTFQGEEKTEQRPALACAA